MLYFTIYRLCSSQLQPYANMHSTYKHTHTQHSQHSPHTHTHSRACDSYLVSMHSITSKPNAHSTNIMRMIARARHSFPAQHINGNCDRLLSMQNIYTHVYLMVTMAVVVVGLDFCHSFSFFFFFFRTKAIPNMLDRCQTYSNSLSAVDLLSIQNMCTRELIHHTLSHIHILTLTFKHTHNLDTSK